MSVFRVEKPIASLPGQLLANTIYLLRKGAGFELHVTDTTGAVAYQLNSSGPAVGTTAPSNPAVGDLWVDTN